MYKTKKKLFFSLVIFLTTPIFSQEVEPAFFNQHNPWKSIQEKARYAVVQIFVQSTPINILHPYRNPGQVSKVGSGFFINDKGDIVTNAHVVDQAIGIWIQIPIFGKRPLRVELVSIYPEQDLALLRLSNESKKFVKENLKSIIFLPLGDSDFVRRSDQVLVLGYPLGQQSLKSTTGVISGREQDMIQIDAAVNSGSSGGPLLNLNGEVVGINASKIVGDSVDNIGYMIPINDLRLVLDDMYKISLLRKPFLGLMCGISTDELTDYLGNPQPGGCFAVEIFENSTLYKAGMRNGDMIYEIDGHRADIYGEISVPWSEDKVSIINYISQLKIGQEVEFIAYRKGERKNFSVKVQQQDLPEIRSVYPGYEVVDYELFGGMVVMQLNNNHINLLSRECPGLFRYLETKKQTKPVLVITHVFHNSQLFMSRTMYPGVTLNEVNGKTVKTLDDFREAVIAGANNKYFVAKGSDNATCATDNLIVVLSMDKILREEFELSIAYQYKNSDLIEKILAARNVKNEDSWN